MKHYVDLVLTNAKKPIEKETLYLKVAELMNSKNEENFKISSGDKNKIDEIVEKGLENYEYIEHNTGKISAIMKTSYRTGRFYGNRNGGGFVITRNFFVNKEGEHIGTESKHSITRDFNNGAIDGDLVLIDIGGNDRKPQIVDIIERNLENVAGEVIRQGNSYFLLPADRRKQNIKIALKGEAIEGQRVAVKLIEQTNNDFYIGEITRVFNHKDDPDMDILWEAFKCGIDDQFSDESLEQLKYIPTTVRDIDKIGREDLTNWKVFTIDGADTKDIDDALSCRKLPNGNYEVGVHIADVSHYVPENSPLDKDAFKRGTSNYLGNKVIPMFPREISNGICSLKPYVERLAMSCIMEINNKGEIVHYRITPTVIKSNLQMTYDNVNNILKDGKVPKEYAEFTEELRTLNKIALLLRKNRIMNGAIEVDKTELKRIYSDKGKIVDFSMREHDLGENLIEEFMVLANETVDKHLSKLGFPCVHRVHDIPSEEKLAEFLKMLEAINLPFSYNAKQCIESSKVMQDLAEHVKKAGKLSMMLIDKEIKCLSRAKYSSINIGHYALAIYYYCHFTSPIRRYPDLTVHRILKECAFIDSESARKAARKWKEKIPDIAMQSSKMERMEDRAEEAVNDMKCAEYMESHIGEEYKGTVTKLSSRGLTVQLDNLVEGKVRLKNMEGRYAHNPNTYTLISLDGKQNYFLGDRLLVKVKAASKEDKTIDFVVKRKIEENYIDDIDHSNQKVKRLAKKRWEKRYQSNY